MQEHSSIQNSDIFLRNNQDQQNTSKPSKKQVNNYMKSNEKSDSKQNGKKMNMEKKFQDHQDLITDGKDMSYLVKKDATKDYSDAEKALDQKRSNYVVQNERFSFMKSDQASQETNKRYHNYKPTENQVQNYKEKTSYNQFWWNKTNSKTKVNEDVKFDKNYAKQMNNQNFQSQIFAGVVEENAEQKQSNVQKTENLKQQCKQELKDDVKNRKNDRNYSNLNGYNPPETSEQQQNKNKQQSDLIPSTMKQLSHDSKYLKFNNGQQQQQNGGDVQNYQNEMKSVLDTHGQEAPKPQSPPKGKLQFQNFQLIDKVEENESILVKFQLTEKQENDLQNSEKKKQEKEIFEFNQSIAQQQKKGRKQLAEDPQKIEDWNDDPYKNRFSLVKQRKPEVQDIEIIEMNLRGISEKFDVDQFKKICSRKGYHIVDLDLAQKLNRYTGNGKLVLRKNRKVPDTSDSVKTHLKSIGVNVVRQNEKTAQLIDKKVHLKPEKLKDKGYFSSYVGNEKQEKILIQEEKKILEEGGTLKNNKKQGTKEQIDDVTSRLYTVKTQERPKEVLKSYNDVQKQNKKPVSSIKSNATKSKQMEKPSNRTSISGVSEIRKKENTIQSQKSEKSEQLSQLLKQGTGESPPKIIKRKRPESNPNAEQLIQPKATEQIAQNNIDVQEPVKKDSLI